MDTHVHTTLATTSRRMAMDSVNSRSHPWVPPDINNNTMATVQDLNQTWYHGLWDSLACTLKKCKAGASYIYPKSDHFMECHAFSQDWLQKDGTFSLVVIVSKHQKHKSLVQAGQTVVWGDQTATWVKPGKLRISLSSDMLEADELHGEESSLIKYENNFRGEEFEKQFACRIKSNTSQRGFLGKVLVDHISPKGVTSPVFEFNLTRRETPDTCLGSRTDKEEESAAPDPWSHTIILELASILQVSEDDKWPTFAKHLGFTEFQIKNHFSSAKHPIASILEAYKGRGGTPEEFVQSLYTVGRSLNIDPGMDPQLDEKDGNGLTRSPSIRIPRIKITADEDNEDLLVCPASPSPRLTPLLCPTPKFLSNLRTLTPPLSLSPRKRKDSFKAYNGPHSPMVTKVRKLTWSDNQENNFFNFELPADHQHRECWEDLSNDVLADVASHAHTWGKWKLLGRNLFIPDMELKRIEDGNNKDLEKCTQDLLNAWHQTFPLRFKYGVLYSALCETGLQSVAEKFCTLPDEEKENKMQVE